MNESKMIPLGKEYHNQLDDYILGMLTPAERIEFERHLESCPSCQQKLEKFNQLHAKIANLPKGIQPARDLWRDIEIKLTEDTQASPGSESEQQQSKALPYEPHVSHRLPKLFVLAPRWYLRAAATILILVAAGAIWFALKNWKPEQKEVQVSQPSAKQQEIAVETKKPQDIDASTTSPREQKITPETASKQTEQEESIATEGTTVTSKGSSLHQEPVIAASEDVLLRRIQTSFVKYSKHLPSDRVYLHFDKPFYKPGETIWFRAYVRSDDLKASQHSDILHVEFINPKGSITQQLTLVAKDGVASGDIDLSSDVPGGIYKVKAYTQWQKNFEDPFFFEKEIQVQSVVLPRLKMKLDFERKAFGPGDNVTAKFEARTLENSILANVDFKYVVKIAGTTFMEQIEKTDRTGTAYVSFDLPNDLSSTDGLLGILVQHEGQIESISRSIPIVLNRIQFTMYPEGGDLVNGLTSDVAFEALNEFNKPADVEGVVLDDQNREITTFISYHQGMGAFTFTPEAHRSYHVNITKPIGVAESFSLPKVLPQGYTLGVQRTSTGKINVIVGSMKNEELYLTAQMRGKLYFTKRFTVHVGTTIIPFLTADLPAGVVQVTLFDSEGIEQAERLVFVNKPKQLTVDVTTDKERYLPREKVTLTIKATDERGKPASGNLSLAVVDDKLISFADDKSGHILSKLLLEADLKGKVEEPNFYFDPKEPKADKALDYLMMTRGWRRFTWKQILADQLPEIKYQPERAVIAGTIVDASTGEPIQGAAVSIETPPATTDSDGKFLLRYPDLSASVVVTVSKRGYETFQTTVSEYTENLHCKLWKVGSKTTVVGGFEVKYIKEPTNDVKKDQRVGNTGMIIGNVVDAKIGEPLVAVNILMIGTNRGAVTDVNGKYSIIGVPIGRYTVRASQVGYEPVEAMNVEIRAGETTLLDLRLASTEVHIAGVTVTAEHGIVNALRTSSTQTIVSAQKIESIPNVKIAEDALKLQGAFGDVKEFKGVESAVHAGAVGQGNNLFLRGGRADEVKYLADGVPTNNIRGEGGIIEERLKEDRSLRKVKKARRRGLELAPLPPAKQQKHYYRARAFPAPIYSPEEVLSVRTDFRSTIFWKGDIVLDHTGKTAVTFYNSDEITSFRATIEGINKNGLVGRVEKTYYTQLPFSMAAKVPVEVSMSDRVSVPLTLKNNTERELTGGVNIKPPMGWKPLSTTNFTQTLAAGSTKTLFIPFEIQNDVGKDVLEIVFESQGLRDGFSQEVFVCEKGFPQAVSFSGSEKERSYNVTLNQPIAGTIQAKLTLYPSVASNLLAGVEAMFREPNGCFEQTSSINYPNVIALRYLREYGLKDAALMSRAEKLLDQGYQKLITFATKEEGYEWFGGTPPHEALTAYALMQFKDMEPVYASIDKTMVDRTTAWLLSRRDGEGGFLRDPKALDSFGRASQEITNAYIVYALAEAGYTDIETELSSAYENALKSQDPYQLALVANALYSVNYKVRSDKVMSELLKTQHEDGSWTGKTHSITRSSGMSLKVETTALAVLAMLKAENRDPGVLQKGIKFLLASRSGYGGFGSTQGTILALKALTEYTRYSKQIAESGTVSVRVNEKTVSTRSYAAGERDPIVLGSLEQFFDAGEQRITMNLAGAKHALPHSLLITWNTMLPASSDSAKVSLDTKLLQSTVRMGETVRLTTTLVNRAEEDIPMTVAVVGIPGGLSPQPWQLKELQEKGVVDFYEIIGRYIAFYYRQMRSNETHVINLDLKAEIPGAYESPASSAYLYYTNEYKSWSSAGTIEITQP
ncbi:MAG: carboxypeptidase-like regulatory domain-containing protein [Ignavibacteriae bacterium]|nr:carboxypeptidase-like regulatory domain-containing protein [Ignavibacteriota bacterium]